MTDCTRRAKKVKGTTKKFPALWAATDFSCSSTWWHDENTRTCAADRRRTRRRRPAEADWATRSARVDEFDELLPKSSRCPAGSSDIWRAEWPPPTRAPLHRRHPTEFESGNRRDRGPISEKMRWMRPTDDGGADAASRLSSVVRQQNCGGQWRQSQQPYVYSKLISYSK